MPEFEANALLRAHRSNSGLIVQLFFRRLLSHPDGVDRLMIFIQRLDQVLQDIIKLADSNQHATANVFKVLLDIPDTLGLELGS
ncbi:hypothetical protein HG531_012921 [Fusarium graminearum]|nr:hypothetical protein HG531_012921 [Fusarium graminearum]